MLIVRCGPRNSRLANLSELRVYSNEEEGGSACARYVLDGPGCHGVLWHKGRILYLLSSSGGIAQLSSDGHTDVLWSKCGGTFSLTAC